MTKELMQKYSNTPQQGAQTRNEDFSLTEIPFEALRRVGKIFIEGQKVYGRGNWRKGVFDKKFQLERANHALKHLLLHIHFLETGESLSPEDDLAKVLWFCCIQCELERLESRHNDA